MTDVYYKWISNGGCEACDALEGIHEHSPDRPHPYCQCTILCIDPSSMPEWCVLDEPLVIDISPGGHEIDFDEEAGILKRAVWQVSFRVVCRDTTIIEGEYRHDDPDIEIPFSSDDDYLAYFEILYDSVERVALEHAESECPACKEELFE